MVLIFIYGPPASGKLTIAQELSKITGIPVFHNHLTRDLVQSIYPDTLDENYTLVNTLRNNVFEYCTQHGTDLIFTFVYSGHDDDESVQRKVNAVRSNGGQVLFVQLNASREHLLERVDAKSRKLHNKLTDRTILNSLLNDLSDAPIPNEMIFNIDTATVQPAEAGKLIVDYYKLK